MGWDSRRFKVPPLFSLFMASNPRASPTNGPSMAIKDAKEGMELPLAVNSFKNTKSLSAAAPEMLPSAP